MTGSGLLARVRTAGVRSVRSLARRTGAGDLVLRAFGLPSDDSHRVERRYFLEASEPPTTPAVMEWMAFRGRFFPTVAIPADIAGSPVIAAAVIFEHEAWERAILGGGTVAWSVPIPPSQRSHHIELGLRCADGHRYVVAEPAHLVLDRHSFHGPHATFAQLLGELTDGLVVEIGARARSGRTYIDLVPPQLDYLGVDIADGPNVDLVGDAHELSSLVAPGTADGIFSIATFEHLAMPWRCVVEMNRVLKPGGVCFILSHQTFPLHESPWDFFRFSDSGWRALFNEATGFEVIDVAMGEAAAVASLALGPISWDMDRATAYLGSSVTCRKIGEATVDWAVPLDVIARTPYPG